MERERQLVRGAVQAGARDSDVRLTNASWRGPAEERLANGLLVQDEDDEDIDRDDDDDDGSVPPGWSD